jgi:hypothetical protein
VKRFDGASRVPPRLPSPDRIRRDMERVQKVCDETTELVSIIVESYDELYDMSLRSQSGNGSVASVGRRNWSDANPTRDAALSGLHKHLRWEVSRVATKLRKLEPILEEAKHILHDAFQDTDPDPVRRERLALFRELDKMNGQGR